MISPNLVSGQTLSLYEKILEVLKSLKQDVPEYFRLLRNDLMVEYGQAQTAIYETPCFWSGETSLAQHSAILTTEAGWIDGEEVVRINFDPNVANLEVLDAFAREEGFVRTSKTNFHRDKDAQYYLSKSRFASLPLTTAQLTRVNLAIAYSDHPEQFLSPRQIKHLSN